MSYSVQNIRNVCLLGHSGSGKTALAESLLFMIRDRVDSEELKVVLKVLDGLETWVKEA